MPEYIKSLLGMAVIVTVFIILYINIEDETD